MQLGPYSRHKRIQNSKIIAELWRKTRLSITHPLMYTDADDILTLATTGFSDIKSIIWSKEIANFDEVFFQALKAETLLPRDNFMDILEETGIELDDRRKLAYFSQTLLGYWYRRILKFSRKLPGMSVLTLREFLLHMAKNTDLLYILMFATTGIYWDMDCLVIKLNDRAFPLWKSKMVNLSDESNVKLHEEIHKHLDKIRLSMEESLFIYSLNLVADNKQPQFKQAHSRLMLSFIRYLQSKNEGIYHKRLLEIVNCIAVLKEHFYSDKKWCKKNLKYVDYMYNDSVCKLFMNCEVVEDCVTEFEKCHL